MLCIILHTYIKTQLLSKSSTVASVFVLFFHAAMSSKVPRLIKKKEKKKPGHLAVGRTRSINFTLDGLNGRD